VSRSDDGRAIAAARRVWDIAGIALDQDEFWGAEDSVAVAWQGGLPVGAGRIVKLEGNARIENVFVLEEMRGRGVGRSLASTIAARRCDTHARHHLRERRPFRTRFLFCPRV